MATLQFKNNFNNLRGDFLKDTGKKADDNMELYTQYVIARISDQNYQLLFTLLNEVMNLPRTLAFEIGRKN
jgi:hypothetical protein